MSKRLKTISFLSFAVLTIAAVVTGVFFSQSNDALSKGKAKGSDNIKSLVAPGVDNDVSLRPNIEYTVANGISLKLHLLSPPDNDKPLPLIVFIQGSGWGPQDTFRYIPQLSEYAEKGYVVATVQYRSSDQDLFPAQIQDIKTAIRYLKANADKYNIDPNRVGVWGNSSGGHIAALVGTTNGVEEFEGTEYANQSSKVQAVVDWYGPTNFLKMNDFPSVIDHDAPDSPESKLIGGPIQENPEKVQKANPINYITSDDAPFLIMHGDKDRLVPYNQSVLLFNALKKANQEATMYNVKGAGHGDGFGKDKVHSKVLKFFDEKLK